MTNLLKNIFLLIFILLVIKDCTAQDTAIVKYFPLNIGNRWVYTRTQNTAFPPGPGTDLVKIDSFYVSNNHVYYVLKTYIYTDQGLYNIILKNYRIDSISGNIYQQVNADDCLNDSLKSRKNDSAICSCENNRLVACIDTNTYSIFNLSPKSKTFDFFFFEYGFRRTYAKNLGMVYNKDEAITHITQRYLRGCIVNGILHGDTSLTGINQISCNIPDKFSLSQNYPNPFNPSTVIKFQVAGLPSNVSIGGDRFVKLIIYDVLGKEISTLVNEQLKPGEYQAEFEGTNLPSGIYYYKLDGGDFIETKKMVLIK